MLPRYLGHRLVGFADGGGSATGCLCFSPLKSAVLGEFNNQMASITLHQR